MNEQNLQQLAAEARKYFTTENPRNVWSRTDEAPEWVREMMYGVHGEMLPDDYKYAFTVDALDILEERGDEDPDELGDEVEPDIYTADLFDWYNSHAHRTGYLDEAVEEGLVEPIADSTELAVALGVAQYLERREVFGLVAQALQEQLDEA